MKGIILAGGFGTRLWPLTVSTSKQLLPVYDKPMIYYPLATLMAAGIRDFLIVTTAQDQSAFRALLADGTKWGVSISYAVQLEPRGIAEAFIIGEKFIGDENVALILGDNVFGGAGQTFESDLKTFSNGALVFAKSVENPERFGVVELDAKGDVISLEEKPLVPKSTLVLPGLYVFDSTVTQKVKLLSPSMRNELEVVDLISKYWEAGQILVSKLPDHLTWFDSGTFESLLAACLSVRDLELEYGQILGSPELTALQMGYISTEHFNKLVDAMKDSPYSQKIALAVANRLPVIQIPQE